MIADEMGGQFTVDTGDCFSIDLQHFTNLLNGYEDEYISFMDSTGLGVTIAVEIDESEVDVGDEIGLFDYNGIINFGDCSDDYSEILVGAGVYGGGPMQLTAYGSMDYCEERYGQYPGFVVGNPVVIRIWDASLDIEYDAEVTYGDVSWIDGIPVWDTGDILVDMLQPDLPAYIPGDINFDNYLNVLDVVLMVQIILGYYPPNPEEIEIGDINGDGVIDVLDIVSMVNTILGG